MLCPAQSSLLQCNETASLCFQEENGGKEWGKEGETETRQEALDNRID